MFLAVKLFALASGMSALGGVCYLVHRFFNPYPRYVMDIYKAQKNFGRCRFGFVKEAAKETGGSLEEAVGSSELDDANATHHKLALAAKNIEDSEDIQNACKEKPGQLVELSGNSNSNSGIKTSPDGTTAHKPPN